MFGQVFFVPLSPLLCPYPPSLSLYRCVFTVFHHYVSWLSFLPVLILLTASDVMSSIHTAPRSEGPQDRSHTMDLRPRSKSSTAIQQVYGKDLAIIVAFPVVTNGSH